MNARTVILSVGLIVFSSGACAQVAPQKGYYAIYNNAKKLSNNNDSLKKTSTPQTTHRLTIAKGYYSIKNNYDKLFPAGTENTNTSKGKSTPVVTKGYYLIGTNKEKLNR